MNGSAVANVAHILLNLSQKLKEELAQYSLATPAIASVTKVAIDKLEEHDGVMTKFEQQMEAIAADVLLSPAGQAKQAQTLAKEFFGKLAFIAEAAENRRQAAAQLRAQLDTLPKAPGDPLIEWMRGAEIRVELRKVTQSERMKRLVQSMEHKDLSILRALEHDPMGPNALVPNDFQLRIREELAETNQAAEYVRWKALVFCAEKLTRLANVLEATLGQYHIDVPTFQTPPIRHVDLKQLNPHSPPPKSKAVDKKPEHHVGTFQ